MPRLTEVPVEELRLSRAVEIVRLPTDTMRAGIEVAQTFFMDAQVNVRTRLDAIVTVADAKHLAARLADSTEAEAQLASADLVLLNKTDLVSADEADRTEMQIRAINPFATIRRTIRAALPIAEVLDRQAFDLRRVLERVPDFMEAAHHPHDDGHHHHTPGVQSVSFEVWRPLVMERFLRWIDSLLALRGEDLLRTKGILAFEGETRRFAFQAVHRVADGDFLDAWPGGERRSSKLVFIGRNLDRERLRRSFEGCQV